MVTFAELQQPGRPVPSTLPLNISNVRTFDTPEFAGMTFLEVEAKSALNKVKGMPFGWSINPYRGCSHACSYCAAGDTPILLGDGRTKPLADIRPGDLIIGTELRGSFRRYVITDVRDHWQTVKPAYRVVLEDGTSLVTSGDHRFLTNNGWKHVAPHPGGVTRRAYLTTNNKLMGTGAFAEAPKNTPSYRHGYLCGMERWYGGLDAAWTRALLYRDGFGLSAIDPVEWPDRPDEDWHKGFLAAQYDAHGASDRTGLRVSAGSEAGLKRLTTTLGALGFADWVVERAHGRISVRLRGGLGTHLRVLHMTAPALTRKLVLEGRAVKSEVNLKVASIEPLGIEMPLYDITTGTGDFIANGVISHNCFARPTHSYLNLNPLDDFEKTVVVKTNVAEVLRRELAKPSWKGEAVAMGTNTDPYQRCEGRYALMPGIIEALADNLTPFSILTKGTLITRDLDRLVQAAEKVPVTAAMTIGMLDEKVWRTSEPGTPSPAARLAAVTALNDAGIPTGVMLAPIMPGINDQPEQLADLVDRIAAAGATHITPIVLHLRPGVREVFWPWLTRHHPALVARYSALYRRSDAADDYRTSVTDFVAEQRKAAWQRHGKPAGANPWRSAGDDRRWNAAAGTARKTTQDPGEQLQLL